MSPASCGAVATIVDAGAASATGGLRAVLERMAQCHARGIRFALALVVETSGSTYRKSGALALVDAAGIRTGVISGGCLESELERLGLAAIASGEDALAWFDTRSDEDLVFGSGSGCRGRMGVWLVPDRHPAFAALAGLERVVPDGHPLVLDLALVEERVAPLRACMAGDVLWSGHVTAAGSESIVGCAKPLRVVVGAPPTVLLLGAGPEAPPLIGFARGLGWQVRVADHRPRYASRAHVGDVDALWLLRPAAAIARIVDSPSLAVLVMTHLAACDLEALEALAARPGVPYVGLLGPPSRRDELLSRLDAGLRASLMPRLHAPVGLMLGGEGPESIALSIVAGLHRYFNEVAVRSPPGRP